MTGTRNHDTTAARNAARNAAFTLARDSGAALTTRPACPGSDRTVRDVRPLAGMLAARDLELGARDTALGYIRRAREAGCSWHQIGAAMHLVPGGDAQQAGDTIADAACTYAAGHPGTQTAIRYGRSFTWTCRACDRHISDRGLISGPAGDERGHQENCPRHAATITAWNAEWEAGHTPPPAGSASRRRSPARQRTRRRPARPAAGLLRQRSRRGDRAVQGPAA
jgi:hypothetical protein